MINNSGLILSVILSSVMLLMLWIAMQHNTK